MFAHTHAPPPTPAHTHHFRGGDVGEGPSQLPLVPRPPPHATTIVSDVNQRPQVQPAAGLDHRQRQHGLAVGYREGGREECKPFCILLFLVSFFAEVRLWPKTIDYIIIERCFVFAHS